MASRRPEERSITRRHRTSTHLKSFLFLCRTSTFQNAQSFLVIGASLGFSAYPRPDNSTRPIAAELAVAVAVPLIARRFRYSVKPWRNASQPKKKNIGPIVYRLKNKLKIRRRASSGARPNTTTVARKRMELDHSRAVK